MVVKKKSDHGSYPYQFVTAAVSNSQAKVVKYLKDMGAERIMISHDTVEVGFKYKTRLVRLGQSTTLFESKQRNDPDKVLKQGWAALRDYVKALSVRFASTEEGYRWELFLPHYLLRDGVTTIGDQVIKQIGSMPLALPPKDGKIDKREDFGDLLE